jgi:lipopolysaccharide transport system ATP-binding protein
VAFAGLEAFVDAPLRTYSSGMVARLGFAVATDVQPEILIVDEVMGAGDAYFIAKSKQRIDRIISRGCTLLLVSHGMSQVLELCDEAIWLEGGRINMIGEAFRVVKAYEEALYGAIPGSGDPSATRRRLDRQGHLSVAPQALKPDVSVTSFDGTLPSEVKETRSILASATQSMVKRLQLPVFMPHAADAAIPAIVDAEGRSFHNMERDGLSRWGGVEGVKIVGFAISGPNGPTDRLISLQPGQMTIFLELEMEGAISLTYGVAIHDLQGRAMCRFFSQLDHFQGKIGDGRRIELLLNPNQIGPGVYTVGISIHEATTIEDVNAALRYDLLSRSFHITVELPDSLAPASAQFFHSCEWNFQAATLPAPVASSKQVTV